MLEKHSNSLWLPWFFHLDSESAWDRWINYRGQFPGLFRVRIYEPRDGRPMNFAGMKDVRRRAEGRSDGLGKSFGQSGENIDSRVAGSGVLPRRSSSPAGIKPGRRTSLFPRKPKR